MSIAQSILSLIEKYGTATTISSNEENYSTRGFVQPLRYKSKMYLDGIYTDEGYCDGSHYLYIGQPLNINTNSQYILESSKGKYVTSTIELYNLLDTPLYMWAVLTKYEE